MSTSAVPAVLYTLRDLLTTAVATADREVVLGARPEGSDVRQRLYVGWSGDLSDLTMARFTQAWAGLGAKRKNEPVEVPCAAVAWTGDDEDTVLDELLAVVFVLFGLAETALRADPGLGRPGPFVASITSAQVVPDLTAGRVRLPFTISVTFSRI